jgi:hypothetical protein
MLLDRARRSRFRIALQSGTVRGTNKSAGAYPSDRPPFPPLPPCLVGHSGRSRRTDRLRPNYFLLFLGIVSWRRQSLRRVILWERGSEFLRRQHVRRGAQRSEIHHHRGDEECGSRGEKRRDPARLENDDRKTYAVACRSRGRALRPKNNAWLATAETTASWNGLAIRKAGSGRCPVRKRSG